MGTAYKMITRNYGNKLPDLLTHKSKKWNRVSVSRVYSLIKHDERIAFNSGNYDTLIIKTTFNEDKLPFNIKEGVAYGLYTRRLL